MVQVSNSEEHRHRKADVGGTGSLGHRSPQAGIGGTPEPLRQVQPASRSPA
jgi:hypothetical protein